MAEGRKITLSEKDNESVKAELSERKQTRILLDEIIILRAYISQLEITIETPKFGQLRWTKKSLGLSRNKIHYDMPNLQIRNLCCDLYRFAGMRCVKFEHGFVFEISDANVTKDGPYAVEILIDDCGHGKLGKWILPMSIDVQEILSRHPIGNLNKMRRFLRSCKHHVDCYIRRARQLIELQDLFSGTNNIRASYTVGITYIEITISGVKDVVSNEIHNVILWLCYNSAEAKPRKLLLDTDNEERPSLKLLKKLNKHFKPFLEKDLISAFQQIAKSQIGFVWEKIVVNDKENNVEIYDSSDDGNTEFLSKFFHRDDKKAKNKAQNGSSILHDKETETSLRVEKEKTVDTDVTEDETRPAFSDKEKDKKIKSRKHKQPQTILKSRDMKKSSNNLKEFKKKISKVEKECDQNVETENAQVKDKNILSEENNNYQSEENLTKRANDKCKGMQRRKLFNKSNNNESNNREHLMNSRKISIKRRKIIQKDENRDYTILASNDKPLNISCSTPFSKKLPDKRKFF